MTVSITDKAHKLRELGLKTAYRLRDATAHAQPTDRKELHALAHRLHFCNQPRNTWLGSDIHNSETGELFEGFGRYWHCGSKLCSYCLRLNAKRNRLTLRTAIEAQKLHVGEHYRFITLTLPNLGLDLPATRKIVNRAWALLRKRQLFVRCVVGGAKAEEFTRTSRGFHYHLHLLTRSKSINAQALRSDWTECVIAAYADTPHEFHAPTKDGLLIVNIKIVHNLRQVSNEVCKYVTKANTWWDIPTGDLIKIALIPQWHRMFEVFGTFRKIDRDKLDRQMRDPSDEYTRKGLWEDTDQLHEARNHWRILIRHMSLAKYVARLQTEIDYTIARRTKVLQLKFPWATLTTLEDP